MELKPQEIQDNWERFLGYINKYISGGRRQQMVDFYTKYEDRIVLMPASNMAKYHNCFPGGYVDHVNRVVKSALGQFKLWEAMGMVDPGFTIEELVFSAINHDLGKMGDMYNDAYIISTDEWRIKNLGEKYTHNTKLQFMSVPDRSLFLLQQHEISISANEYIAIKTHDGLYDPANEAYLKPFTPEAKPRTSLPYILHMADMMSARIEFEREYMAENIKVKPAKPKK